MAATLEERVAYLEGKVEEHSKGLEDLKHLIINLDQKVDRFREELSSRIDALDQKVGRRIDALDQKVDIFKEELSSRIDALDQKFSRYFLWLIGIQITILLAIIASLLQA